MKKRLLFLVIPFVFAGCQTQVRYGEAGDVETVTADFGSTDLQLIAEKMASSLLRHPALEGGKRPVIALGSIDNRTNEHIETPLILSKVSTALLGSGKVKLVADQSGQNEVGKEIARQQSGAVSADSARTFGKQVGAEFVLYGRLTSIDKKAGGVRDLYYNFTLNLVNVETALIEWKEEKEIRKVTEKGKIGW